jgi:F-type H+-transporting ATPase subunit b
MKDLGRRAVPARIRLFFILALALGAGSCAIPQRVAASTTRFAAIRAISLRSSREQLGAQLAKESREAAGEDDAGQFKHSASVQWVAKVTGLSLERAYQLSVLLNFVVVAVVIFWAVKKYLPGVFRNRTISIQKAMEEARKASEDANRRLSEIEARLSKFDAEIAQMKAEAEKQAIAEEQTIKAAAEEDARKIVEAAEQEIAAAAKTARRELTAYAADLAVTLARKQIHVDANTDQALLGDFARQLSAEKRNGGN